MIDNLLYGLTIGAWFILLLYLVVAGLRAFQIGGMKEVWRTVTSIRVFGIVVIIVLLTFLSASLVFIEPQEAGVVISVFSRDGYREQPMRSGLHFIVPLAERVILYPVFWQSYTMSNEPLEGAKAGNDAVAARTSDGQSVFVDLSLIYRLDPNEVVRMHIDLQDRYVADFIRPMLRGVVRTEVSQFTADEVNSSKRKDLEANLDDLLREALSEKGIVLDRFLLRNISFSTEYAKAIESKQVAEQERTRADYQAEVARRIAQGQSDAVRIQAEGRAAAIRLEGQAEADIVLIKAQAEAEALKLINEILAQNENLLTYRYIDKLSPNIRAMLLPSNNPLLLPLPDVFSDSTDSLAPPIETPTASPTPTSGATPPGLLPTTTPTPTPTATTPP